MGTLIQEICITNQEKTEMIKEMYHKYQIVCSNFKGTHNLSSNSSKFISSILLSWMVNMDLFNVTSKNESQILS